MARNITVTFADGTIHVYQNAPDDVTPDAVEARAMKEFGKTVQELDGGRQPAQAEIARAAAPVTGNGSPVMDTIKQGARDLAGGLVRGAGSIGATILAPYDMAKDALDGRGLSLESNRERRKQMDEGLTELVGSNPDNLMYKGGKLVGEIAGTAGTGGVLAKGAQAAGAAPGMVNAIRTAGFAGDTTGSTGPVMNALTRVAGGAVTGAASTGMTDPEASVGGAMVGAALPPVIAALGKGGEIAGKVWRGMQSTGDTAGASALVKALGIASPAEKQAIIDKLRSAETLVPGASPTVAQALQTPEAGVLNRVVYDSPGGAALRSKIAQQGEARKNALEAVAPTDANGFASARADLGNAIASRVIPEENAISKTVSSMYRAVDKDGKEAINLPVSEMQAAVDKYLGKGTFGASGEPANAVQIAKGIAKPSPTEAGPQLLNADGVPFNAVSPPRPTPATWDEVGNLRKSLNKALNDATLAGDKQAVGALTAQKQAIDAAIERDLSPQALAAFNEANASHAAKMDRFHTGPQKAIFRKGPDGLPLVEGGEVAGKFWGSGPGAAENVASFRKLIDDNPHMLGQFKSMVATQGAGTADAAGNLTTKFSKWVEQTLPGLRESFSPDELKTLQNIAADIDRNAAATKAGTSLGGSNTYQNAANALDLGMLDSPVVTRLANNVPVLKGFMGPALESIRVNGRNAKAAALANILSDSSSAANALERLTEAGVPSAQANKLVQALGLSASRAAPVAYDPRR